LRRPPELNPSDTSPFTQEYLQIFQAFEKCLSLRDKYMQVSLQRLGDNPRDHDGCFQGLDPKIADVSGVRPDADISAYTSADSEDKLPRSPHKPWRIYPKPPPPHWHWIADTEPVHGSDEAEVGKEEFVFGKCEIPGGHDGWSFGLDEMGVYQVYNADGSLRVLPYFR
jgi:AMP deaminase